MNPDVLRTGADTVDVSEDDYHAVNFLSAFSNSVAFQERLFSKVSPNSHNPKILMQVKEALDLQRLYLAQRSRGSLDLWSPTTPQRATQVPRT